MDDDRDIWEEFDAEDDWRDLAARIDRGEYEGDWLERQDDRSDG